VREGRPVGELAREHGVHPSWLYRLLARYRAEGDPGLIPRSRRPKHSPTATSDELENEIVLLRKQLSEEGLDAGAQTIHWHLSRRHFGHLALIGLLALTLSWEQFPKHVLAVL
jgi:transposase-like protein